jgi:hypothetical protein
VTTVRIFTNKRFPDYVTFRLNVEDDGNCDKLLTHGFGQVKSFVNRGYRELHYGTRAKENQMMIAIRAVPGMT